MTKDLIALILIILVIIGSSIISIYLIIDVIMSLINGTGTVMGITLEVAGAFIGVPLLGGLLYYIILSIFK